MSTNRDISHVEAQFRSGHVPAHLDKLQWFGLVLLASGCGTAVDSICCHMLLPSKYR
jgi:hypothetical protein